MKSQNIVMDSKIVSLIKPSVSKSWLKARGMLSRHKKDLERHIKTVRLEWRKS